MASLLDRIDLDELEDASTPPEPEYDPDPVPAVPARKGRLRAVVRSERAPAPPPSMRKIKVELEAYIELAALGVIVRDPLCGQAIHDQARPVADALATILARHPDLAAKLIGAGVIGDWAKLLMAVKPIVEMIWAHHVTHTIGDPAGGDNGQPATPADIDRYAPFRPGA